MEVFLETERLLLRRFTEGDADLLFELDSDPEVVRYANPGGKTTPYEEIRHRILPRILSYYERYGSLGFWAALEKSSGRFVGWFVLRPAEDGGMAKALAESPEDAELGYRLKRNAWGKGYATEGSRALVEKGFRELGVRQVVALADKDNKASVRVMQKVGLRFERVLSDPASLEGTMDAVGYALKGEEFIAR